MGESLKLISPSHFEKVRQLGSGSTGKVYLVKEKTTQSNYVIKFIKTEVSDNSIIQSHLDKISRVKHNRILPLIGYSYPDSTKKRPLSLVTKYQENGSLFSNLQKLEGFSNLQKMKIIFGICEALRYLHDFQIVHQQLYLTNILLDHNNCPLITDYSQDLFAPNRRNVPQRSRAFIAPELHAGKSPSPASDVFSFGMVVYSLIMEKLPFDESQQHIFTTISTGKRPPLTDKIPECLQKLISQCWEQDPEKRPTFEAILMRLIRNEYNLPMKENEIVSFKNFILETVSPTFAVNALITSTAKIDKLDEQNANLTKTVDSLKTHLESLSVIVTQLQKNAKGAPPQNNGVPPSIPRPHGGVPNPGKPNLTSLNLSSLAAPSLSANNLNVNALLNNTSNSIITNNSSNDSIPNIYSPTSMQTINSPKSGSITPNNSFDGSNFSLLPPASAPPPKSPLAVLKNGNKTVESVKFSSEVVNVSAEPARKSIPNPQAIRQVFTSQSQMRRFSTKYPVKAVMPTAQPVNAQNSQETIVTPILNFSEPTMKNRRNSMQPPIPQNSFNDQKPEEEVNSARESSTLTPLTSKLEIATCSPPQNTQAGNLNKSSTQPPIVVPSPPQNFNDPEMITSHLSLTKFPKMRDQSAIQYPYAYSPFDGIVAHLTAEVKGNIVEKGLLTITGNSADKNRDHDLMLLVDYDWNRCWTSTNTPNSWVQFDFGNKQICITHYTIKTYPCGRGYSHLKSWVIEGSTNGQNWSEIDRRDDNNELNGKSKVATFMCASLYDSQFIRLRQTGPNHYGDHYLILTNIEFFGDLV
ncbi:hypothetical protein TRFO_28198 [Tritrichomonas foetus]|uniref:Protein kinase domain-containing protein n=1 Tax=Tritrichomonas foetus TaxID=1144522 RepID=A0A1J4JYT2_9EUKA|nr:hypothetical protein TRFO_28198 [Tritrichomonas foetus]|eukprot:OHT04313.1 hypothetical protein TRFO_28198 [Tritrichomonas foetus]